MVVLSNLFCLERGYLLRLALLLTFLILCFSLQIRNRTWNALSCYFHHSAVSLSMNLRLWGWEVMSWVKSEIWFLALEGYRYGFCVSHQFRSSWYWKVMTVMLCESCCALLNWGRGFPSNYQVILCSSLGSWELCEWKHQRVRWGRAHRGRLSCHYLHFPGWMKLWYFSSPMFKVLGVVTLIKLNHL